MLEFLDRVFLVLWFVVPLMLIIRGRFIAFQCALMFFWLAPFIWGMFLGKYDPDGHPAMADHTWLVVGLPAGFLYCGAIAVGKWMILTTKKGRPKFELVTEYPITEYKCGLRRGDIIRLRKDLTIRDYKGNKTGVFPQGEESIVLSGTEGVIFLSRPNRKRHTWSDDESIFDFYELVGHVDE